MKKLSLIALMAIPFLVGCNNTEDADTPWSDEQVQIMETHLKNNLLPYIDLEGISLTYSRSKDSVDITAPNATNLDYETYKSRLTGYGYTLVETQCLKDHFSKFGFHTYSKLVEGGIIYVDLYCIDSSLPSKEDNPNCYATNGQFNVNAYCYDVVAGEHSPIEWTVIQERIMTTYVDGNIIPDCNVPDKELDAILTYDMNNDPVIHGVSVVAPYANRSDVQEYINVLVDNEYTNVVTNQEHLGFYEYKLELENNNFLHVQIYTYEEVNGALHLTEAGEGEFHIDIFIEE